MIQLLCDRALPFGLSQADPGVRDTPEWPWCAPSPVDGTMVGPACLAAGC